MPASRLRHDECHVLELAAKPLRLGDRPDVPLTGLDLAVFGVEEQGEPAAVRGRRELVLGATQDRARDPVGADPRELGPEVEIVHVAREPEGGARRDCDVQYGSRELAKRVAAANDLAGESTGG